MSMYASIQLVAMTNSNLDRHYRYILTLHLFTLFCLRTFLSVRSTSQVDRNTLFTSLFMATGRLSCRVTKVHARICPVVILLCACERKPVKIRFIQPILLAFALRCPEQVCQIPALLPEVLLLVPGEMYQVPKQKCLYHGEVLLLDTYCWLKEVRSGWFLKCCLIPFLSRLPSMAKASVPQLEMPSSSSWGTLSGGHLWSALM